MSKHDLTRYIHSIPYYPINGGCRFCWEWLRAVRRG
jgi:hypothetical protein